MRVINLTMPLYEGMGVGRIYPQESEFNIESITSWEEGGARLDVFRPTGNKRHAEAAFVNAALETSQGTDALKELRVGFLVEMCGAVVRGE